MSNRIIFFGIFIDIRHSYTKCITHFQILRTFIKTRKYIYGKYICTNFVQLIQMSYIFNTSTLYMCDNFKK